MGRAFEFRKARKMKRWSAMAKTFTRIGKDIVMAVKEGGPNPDTNSRLRAGMQNVKAANMPPNIVEEFYSTMMYKIIISNSVGAPSQHLMQRLLISGDCHVVNKTLYALLCDSLVFEC